MTDLVERLRDAHPFSTQYAHGSMILAEAADTIDTLRKRIAELETYIVNDMRDMRIEYKESLDELAALKAGKEKTND